MSEGATRSRWYDVAVYLVISIVLLIVAGALSSGVHDDASKVALVGAAAMFGFALWSAWKK